MTAAIRVICRRCAKETPSQATRDGVCVICITAEVVAPIKAEYERVWVRYERYKSNPRIRAGQIQNVEKQLARLARRLGDQVHTRIGNPELAISIINAHLEQARQKAVHPTLSRIVLPKTGDLTRRLQTAS